MISGYSGNNSNRANAAFMVGFFTILGAWAFELIGGYQPCELCLGQRVPYYIGLPLIAILIVGWKTIPIAMRITMTLAAVAIFLWGTYLGTFHAGVEWGFWPGPTACTGGSGGLSFSDLNAINDVRVVPCDEPQFIFLGLSFAGYNALISALVSGLLIWSSLGQYRRMHSAKTA